MSWEQAAAVDALLDRALGGEHTPYEWLVRAVSKSTTRVLDVECGNGGLLRRLVTKGRTVIGLDTSSNEDLLEVEGAQVVPGTLTQMPFEDGSFDAVVSVFGIGTASQQLKVLGEVARVLRPGGIFAALLPSLRPVGGADLALLSRLAGFLRVTPQLPGPSEFKARKTLKAVGLTKVEDARARYHVEVRNEDDAQLVIQGLRQAPDRERSDSAVDFLTQRAATSPVFVPLPARRVVAIK